MQLIERAVAPAALAAAAGRSGRLPSRRSRIALAGARPVAAAQRTAAMIAAITGLPIVEPVGAAR